GMDRSGMRFHRRRRDANPDTKGGGGQVTPWFGIVVPAGTPQPIGDRISNALEVALATPDVQQKLDLAGCEEKSAPLKQFADIIRTDVVLWARVVKDAGIPAD